MSSYVAASSVPRPFVYRRLHSLMGLWFLIFLIEHLFTNSQVALFFFNDAYWYVHSVDWLQSIPYLKAVEVGLLGVPIAYHAILGISYALTSKSNSFHSNGTTPMMKYGRNRAYTWQRTTSWILLIGIVLHVAQMRFLDYPYKYGSGGEAMYYSKLSVDPKLYASADKLGVKLYDQKGIEREKEAYLRLEHKLQLIESRKKELAQEAKQQNAEQFYSSEMDNLYQSLQKYQAFKEHLNGLASRKIEQGEVIAAAKSFGALELLTVRQAFQSVALSVFYTIFVIAAVFHGFNGLWTFLITWGVILSRQAQSTAKNFSLGLMFIVGFLGLLSIWGTFFSST